MFKDIVSLLKTAQIGDGAGGFTNQVSGERVVYANKKSVRQSEFYMAAQAGIRTEAVFVINLYDYEDERLLKHENTYYSIIRTYERGDFIELTCRREVGNLEEVLLNV